MNKLEKVKQYVDQITDLREKQANEFYSSITNLIIEGNGPIPYWELLRNIAVLYATYNLNRNINQKFY